jgi:hypothetical protein
VLFFYIKTEYALSISLLVMIFLTFLVTVYIKKGNTTKFKTKKRMKLFKRKNEEKENE